MDDWNDCGATMHGWASDLFPICRSITGPGVRETLAYLAHLMPALKLHEVPSGTRVFDWLIPDEWNIRDAYVTDSSGQRVIDFKQNNLHVMGYSQPINTTMSRRELEPHLYSLPDQPNAIPYVTSYYSPAWAFCIAQEHRDRLGDGPFTVVIDSELQPGFLTYADLVIPGETDEEVLLSTYVCHPSMANNELSGPVVATMLARWLDSLPSRRYTYRFVFAPETIGPITYLSQHLDHLRSQVKAGWVLTCLGDDRAYSYLPSRLSGTLADRISSLVLRECGSDYTEYSFLERGSDERQWCSPGADLPVCSVMRSKYGTYPEYHTSLDDLSLITPAGLQGGFDVMRRCLEMLEVNHRWLTVMPGEPQLGARGLYPAVSSKGGARSVRTMMNALAYCDGDHDVVDLCEIVDAPSVEILRILNVLTEAGVIRADKRS